MATRNKCTCYDGLADMPLSISVPEALIIVMGFNAMPMVMASRCSASHEHESGFVFSVPENVIRECGVAFRDGMRRYDFACDMFSTPGESNDQLNDRATYIRDALRDTQDSMQIMFGELLRMVATRISKLPFCEHCRAHGAPDYRPEYPPEDNDVPLIKFV